MTLSMIAAAPRRMSGEPLLRSNDLAAPGAPLSSDGAPTFVDVFAGCGGLTLGPMCAGWRGMFAVEKDAFAFATLEANFLQPNSRYRFEWPKWLPKESCDVRALLETHAGKLKSMRGSVDLLAGGPPCQGFSSAGRRKLHDPRNQLFRDYVSLVELLQPRMILLENVEGITYPFGEGEVPGKKMDRGNLGERESYAEAIEKALAKSYHVFTSIVRCSEHGIPQSRPRFILIGYRKTAFQEADIDHPFEQLDQCKQAFLAERGLKPRTTARQAISDLEIRATA